MKHSEGTKKKISETLKRKGIKPMTLPSKEQCKINLEKAHNKIKEVGVWNKGLVGSMSGDKNGMYKNGCPKCSDCGKDLQDYHVGRCRECWIKYNKGENHYKWTGGQDNELKVLRSSAEYKHWRKGVYHRYWFTCQTPDCGYKGKDIEAHHIKMVKENRDLILDVNNGITLCKDCHKKIRNKEQEFEVLFTEIVQSKIKKVA